MPKAETTPDLETCEALLAASGQPEARVRHSRLVAETAWILAGALNARGLALDADALLAAGLLHDLAKGEPGHARAGAERLAAMGWPRLARMVEAHVYLPLERARCVDETTVLYLADKLADKDRLAGVRARFRARLAKAGKDKDKARLLGRQTASALAVQRAVEAALSEPVMDALSRPLKNGVLLRCCEKSKP